METIKIFSGVWAAMDGPIATDGPVATDGPTNKNISIKKDKHNPVKIFLPLCIGFPAKPRE
jgi:hypothetical protein